MHHFVNVTCWPPCLRTYSVTVSPLLIDHRVSCYLAPVGVCILVAATVMLWLAAATVRSSSASATTDPCVEVLNQHDIFITYNDYLGFAGILVIMLIFAIAISVFVGIGLTVDSLPRPAKLLAAACSLVPVGALLLFMLWLALGTAMAVICPFRPTALFYIGLMWLYFLIVVVIGIISALLLAQSAKRAVQKAIK